MRIKPTPKLIVGVSVVAAAVLIGELALSSNTKSPNAVSREQSKVQGATSTRTSSGSSNSHTSTSDHQSVGRYITPAQAFNDVGKFETVRFHVGRTYTDGEGTEFLDQYQNYQSGFVVTIFRSDLYRFSVDPATVAYNKTIEVSGLVKRWDTFTEILNPDRIRIL